MGLCCLADAPRGGGSERGESPGEVAGWGRL